jgi:hypothetical protein
MVWSGSWGSITGGDVIVKLDPTGAKLWDVVLPFTGNFGSVVPTSAVQLDPAAGSAVATGPLSGTVNVGCGSFTGSGVYGAMFDTNGNCLFSKAAGTSASFVLAGDRDYLVGQFTGTLDVGCGPMTSAASTYYVAALSSTGTCIWSRSLPVTSLGLTPLPTDQVLVVAAPGSAAIGCAAVTGSDVVAKLDASGDCAWSLGVPQSTGVATFPGGDVAVTSSYSGTVNLGCGPLTSVGTQDLAVGRLANGTGACAWSNSFGAAGASVSASTQVSALGYLVMTPVATAAVDFGGGATTSAVVELDGSGAFRFQQSIGGGTPVALDPCGPVVFATYQSGVTVTKLAP